MTTSPRAGRRTGSSRADEWATPIVTAVLALVGVVLAVLADLPVGRVLVVAAVCALVGVLLGFVARRPLPQRGPVLVFVLGAVLTLVALRAWDLETAWAGAGTLPYLFGLATGDQVARTRG